MKVRRKRVVRRRKINGPINYGRRCKGEYCPACIVCEGYKFLDGHGRFPTFEEAIALCEAAITGTPVPVS